MTGNLNSGLSYLITTVSPCKKLWISIFPTKQLNHQKHFADREANVCSEPELKKKEDVFLSLAFGFNVPEKMYFQCIKIWPTISRFFSNLIEHKNTWLLSISFLSYGNLLKVHIRFESLMGIQTTMIFFLLILIFVTIYW